MKPISKRYDPSTGKLTPIELTPDQLERHRAEVAERFTPDGRDLLFERMIARLGPARRPSHPSGRAESAE